MKPAEEAAWGDLAATWRTQDQATVGPVEPIRRAVDRQTAMLRLVVVGEVLVTVVAVGVVWWVLAAERQAVRLGWVGAAGLHTAIVWTFVLWNRRGIWKPLGQSTAGYLRLAIERLHRQRLSADFVLGLIGLEFGGLVVWALVRQGATEPGAVAQGARMIGAAAAVSSIAVLWAWRQRAAAINGLVRFAEVDRQLRLDDVSTFGQ